MDLETAVERGEAVGHAAQARAGGRIGAAHPIIAHLDDGMAVGAPDTHPGCSALAYLATFVSDSATTK